jgi:hypothetical protein
MAKMSHGRSAVTVQFGRTSTASGAPFGSALDPRRAPAVVVQTGAPPPSDDSAWDALARWINGGGLLGGSGSALGQIRIGYGKGVLIPNRRWQKS